jgi:hypothetical protein
MKHDSVYPQWQVEEETYSLILALNYSTDFITPAEV